MLRRLVRKNVVAQSQNMAQSLTCDPSCSTAKYGGPSSCQKWAQMEESGSGFVSGFGSVAKRVKRRPSGSFKTLHQRRPSGTFKTLHQRRPSGTFKTSYHRLPVAPPKVQEPRKFHNLLSHRRPVDPSRLQIVNERYQKFIAEVELRQVNANPFVRRYSLDTK